MCFHSLAEQIAGWHSPASEAEAIHLFSLLLLYQNQITSDSAVPLHEALSFGSYSMYMLDKSHGLNGNHKMAVIKKVVLIIQKIHLFCQRDTWVPDRGGCTKPTTITWPHYNYFLSIPLWDSGATTLVSGEGQPAVRSESFLICFPGSFCCQDISP